MTERDVVTDLDTDQSARAQTAVGEAPEPPGGTGAGEPARSQTIVGEAPEPPGRTGAGGSARAQTTAGEAPELPGGTGAGEPDVAAAAGEPAVPAVTAVAADRATQDVAADRATQGAAADRAAQDAGPDEDRPRSRPLPCRLRLTAEAVGMALAGWMLAFLYIPALRDRGQTIFQDVTTNAWGPDEHGLADWIRHGVFPSWTRTTYGGAPYFANLQHGTAYLGNLPFVLLPTSTAFDVVIALHLAAAFLGMWALLRLGLRTSFWAAAFGGLCFTVGSNALTHVILGDQFYATCLMPLVFFAGHMALERRRLRWTVFAAVMMGLQFLAGHPEPWLYTMAALALYGVAWIAFRERGDVRRRAWQAVRYLGGAVVLMVPLFSWQLLPTLALKSLGYRTSPSFNQQYPLPKASGVNALLPDFGRVLVGENQAFIGTAALCLVGLALVARRRGLLWVKVWLGVTAAAGFVMALGNQDPVASFLYHHSTLIRSFRVPSRYLLVTYLALCVGAALGLDELLYSAVGRWRTRLTQGALAVAALGVGLGVALLLADLRNDGASWRKWVGAAGVAGLVYLAGTLRRVPRSALALALIVLTGAELYYARPYAEYRQKVPDIVYDDYGPTLAALGDNGGRYITIAGRPTTEAQARSIPIPPDIAAEILKRNYYLVTAPTRLGARPGVQLATHAETILGRDGGLLPLRTYREFYLAAMHAGGDLNSGVTATAPSKWNWTALDFLSIEWFITRDDLPDTERAVLTRHGFVQDSHDAYVLRWRRPAPPLARLVHQVDVLPSAEARVSALSGDYPLLQRAIVDRPVSLDPAPTGTERVEVTALHDTSVSVRTASPARSLLVLADPIYPGWRVTVDGRPGQLLTADNAFRGVVVPAGSHEVRFTYTDDKFRLGLLLAGLTILGLVLTTVAAAFVRRRRRTAATPGAEPADDAAPADQQPVDQP